MKEQVLDIKKQIETLKQMFEVIDYDKLEEISDFHLEMFNYYLTTTIQDLYKFDDFVDFKLNENEKKDF